MPSRGLSPEQRILQASKRLDLTLDEIKRTIDKDAGNLKSELLVPRMRGELRIQIRCPRASFTSWAMAVVLYSSRFTGRIDCIDWEPLFVCMNGLKCAGYHRHMWNAKVMSCEKFKAPLPLFRPSSTEEFIVQGLKLFTVSYRED
jgi:hypothetical protein